MGGFRENIGKVVVLWPEVGLSVLKKGIQMSKIDPGPGWRLLAADEKVKKGDEVWAFECWNTSSNWLALNKNQMFDTTYRRRLVVPQSTNTNVPSVPVHVVWAETPSTVRTVAEVASESPPAGLEKEDMTGYRVLARDEKWEKGDEHKFIEYLGDGKWYPVGSSSLGMTAETWEHHHPAKSYKIIARRAILKPVAVDVKPSVDPGEGYRLLQLGETIEKDDEHLWDTWEPVRGSVGMRLDPGHLPIRRKLPPTVAWRPYADAHEAAMALKGKMIRMLSAKDYYAVNRVLDNKVDISAMPYITFEELMRSWVFTDGSPCAVKISN